MSKMICKCCHRSFETEKQKGYSCPKCGWIQNDKQEREANNSSGPNSVSLNKARELFFRHLGKQALMKARYIGESDPLILLNGKEYSVISVEKGWYRIIDETGEDYLYPPGAFEIYEE